MVTVEMGALLQRVALAGATVAVAVLLAAQPACAVGGPTIEPLGVSKVGEREATFEVAVDPNGLPTSYGLLVTFAACQAERPPAERCFVIIVDQEVAGGELPAGEESRRFSFTVSTLYPGYGYLYSVYASNADGMQTSPEGLLTMEPIAPKTTAAEALSDESALLAGEMGPQESGPGFGDSHPVLFPRPWYFQYAPGSSCAGPEARRTTEESLIPATYEVSAEVSGLSPSTEYTACLIEGREGAQRLGSQVSFTTPPAPSTPSEPAGVGQSPPGSSGQPPVATVPMIGVSAYATQSSTPAISVKAMSKLARALRSCARKPRRMRARCARRVRRLYGARHRRHKA